MGENENETERRSDPLYLLAMSCQGPHEKADGDEGDKQERHWEWRVSAIGKNGGTHSKGYSANSADHDSPADRGKIESSRHDGRE